VSNGGLSVNILKSFTVREIQQYAIEKRQHKHLATPEAPLTPKP
jgi:hypothetical protein